MEKKYAAAIERTFAENPAPPHEGLGCTLAGIKAIKIFYNQPPSRTVPLPADKSKQAIAEIIQYAAPR